MKIIVLDGYTLNPGDNPWDEVSKLGAFVCHDRTPGELIVERAKDADIILTNKTPLSADTLARLPQLRFISVLATGDFVKIDFAKNAESMGARAWQPYRWDVTDAMVAGANQIDIEVLTLPPGRGMLFGRAPGRMMGYLLLLGIRGAPVAERRYQALLGCQLLRLLRRREHQAVL